MRQRQWSIEARPVTLAPAHARYVYVGHAVACPMSIAGVGLGLGLGAYIGGPILALVMLAVAAAVTWVVSGTRSFQRSVDQAIRGHRRLKRRLEREQRLEGAGLQRDALAELTCLVDDIDRSDGGQLVNRLELDERLDQYARISIARHPLLRAIRPAHRGQLERELADARYAAERGNRARASARRIALIERRVRWADDCAERAARCGEELAAIDQFIRLVNQRAACPDLVAFDLEAVDRRLLDFDEEEVALRQLLAGEQEAESDLDGAPSDEGPDHLEG